MLMLSFILVFVAQSNLCIFIIAKKSVSTCTTLWICIFYKLHITKVSKSNQIYYLHELNSVVQTNNQYLKMYVTSNTLEIT